MKKAAKKPSSPTLKRYTFSHPHFIVFVLIFAAIGGYILLHSYAYTTNSVALDGANNVAPNYLGSDYSCGNRSGYAANPTLTSKTRPTFNVAANGGLASYEWYVDGVKQAGTVNGDGHGLACFTLDHNLSDGAHSFYAVELAPHAGNHTTPDPFNFTVDTAGPPAPSTPVLSAYIDGGLPGDNITKFRNLNFTGTATPGVTVTLYTGPAGLGGSGLLSGTQYSVTTTQLADGTYDIYAVATDTASNKSAPSEPITVTVENVPPTAPTNFCLSSTTAFSNSVSWTTSSTDNSGMYAYILYRKDNVDTVERTMATFSQQPFANSFSDNALISGRTYTYRLTAMDVAGNETGAASTLVVNPGSTTPTCSGGSSDTTPPSTPGNFQSSSKTTTSINLSWSASTDSGGSGLAGYKLSRGGTLIATIPAGTTSYSDTGRTANTAYNYSLVAYDNATPANTSLPANLSVTTNPSPPGDSNGDGHVTQGDLTILVVNFNSSTSFCDFNHDGTVNFLDVSILLSNFGT